MGYKATNASVGGAMGAINVERLGHFGTGYRFGRLDKGSNITGGILYICSRFGPPPPTHGHGFPFPPVDVGAAGIVWRPPFFLCGCGSRLWM